MNVFDVQGFDEGTAYGLNVIQNNALNSVFKTITHLGDWQTITGISALIILTLAFKKQCNLAIGFLCLSLAAVGFTHGMKYVIHRPRPDLPHPVIPVPHTSSFPSGHSLQSAAIYPALALLLGRRIKSNVRRIMIISFGFFLPLIIGFSRAYLCVHWITDVFAGWSVGLAFALLFNWYDLAMHPSPMTNSMVHPS